MWVLFSAFAADWAASCAAEKPGACDRHRFELTTSWARGEAGVGPQVSWKRFEVLFLEHRAKRARDLEACAASPNACDRLGGALGHCLLGGECPENLHQPSPEPVLVAAESVVLEGDHRDRQIAVVHGRGIEGWPRSEYNEAPGIEDVEVFVPAVSVGVPFWEGTLPAEGSLEVPGFAVHSSLSLLGLPERVALPEPYDAPRTTKGPRSDCAVLVVDAQGEPVEGALVYAWSTVARTDSEGMAPVCGRPIVAVHEDASGTSTPEAYWRIELHPGARPQCRVGDAGPFFCDRLRHELPEPLREGSLFYEGRDANGVHRVRGPHRRWPDNPGIAGPYANLPDDIAKAAVGWLCANDDERWVRCPVAYRFVDEKGNGVGLQVQRPDPTIDGHFFAWPDYEPDPVVPSMIRREGNTFVVLGRPRSGEPVPALKWGRWRKKDATAMAEQALKAAGLPAPPSMTTFPGGASFERGGMLGFVDATTAVLMGIPGMSEPRMIVTLPEVSP